VPKQPKSGDGHDPRLALELERRLIDAGAQHGESIDALQQAACNYFDSLRASGLTTVDALVELREFVFEIQSRRSDGDGDGDGDGTGAGGAAEGGGVADPMDDAIMHRIVRWCVERSP